MILYWVAILAVSTLLYVLLDGFDLGIGILSMFARGEQQRDAMLQAVAPVWDGNETWLVVTGVVLWGAFPSFTRPSCPHSIYRCWRCSQA